MVQTETEPLAALRRPTLRDVAARAGVGTSTVARVVHNEGYVADDTRRLVLEAIAATGFRINAVAQHLRTQRTDVLGHVLHSISPNPFFAEVALGAEQAAAASGRTMLLALTNGDPDLERRGVEALIQRRVDAILFTTVVDPANVALAVAARVPVVQVERPCAVATASVTVDNHRGAWEAASHLADLGHRRIACLAVDPGPSPDHGTPTHHDRVEHERLQGHRDALRDHGLPDDPALLGLAGSYYDMPAARTLVGAWLDLPRPERPTAVFATCDILAAAVLQEVHARRLRVPDDLSLVGFDDTVADHLAPRLTTVRQPMPELGQAAVRLALAAVRGEPAAGTASERLAARLVVRESTSHPPAGPFPAGPA